MKNNKKSFSNKRVKSIFFLLSLTILIAAGVGGFFSFHKEKPLLKSEKFSKNRQDDWRNKEKREKLPFPLPKEEILVSPPTKEIPKNQESEEENSPQETPQKELDQNNNESNKSNEGKDFEKKDKENINLDYYEMSTPQQKDNHSCGFHTSLMGLTISERYQNSIKNGEEVVKIFAGIEEKDFLHPIEEEKKIIIEQIEKGDKGDYTGGIFPSDIMSYWEEYFKRTNTENIFGKDFIIREQLENAVKNDEEDWIQHLKKELLNELIFFIVYNPSIPGHAHASLLVYYKKANKFFHYDSWNNYNSACAKKIAVSLSQLFSKIK